MSDTDERAPSPQFSDKLEMSLEDVIQESKKKERSSRPASSSRGSESSRTPYERPGGRNRRVYVGNIGWRITWGELKDHMKTIGPVEFVDIFTDRDGRSRGCGVVEFTHAEDAERAIKEMMDSKIPGSDRPIFVREDREDTKRRPRDEGSVRGPRSRPEPGCQVFVDNLPYNTDWRDLKDYFKKYAHVVKADVIKERDGRSAGRGVVLFGNTSDARHAIREANEQLFDGRRIFVREDKYA